MQETDLKPANKEAVERAIEIAIRLGLIAAMILLCVWVMRPFLVPILWGIIIAVAAWPGYSLLLGLLKGRRLLSSSLFTLLALILLILPVLMLSGTVVEGVSSIHDAVHQGELNVPPAPDLSAIPVVGPEVETFWSTASENLEEALESIRPQLQMIGTRLLSFAANAGAGILHLLIAIVIAAILLAKSEGADRVASALAQRLAGDQGRRFAVLAESVVRSVSRGILGIALIQALLGGLGMLVAGVPAAGLWAILIMILATIQIGAFPVLLVAAGYLFYTGDLTTAILFAIWSAIVASLDNVLKPLLLGRGVPVPMAVIFIGAIGGLLNAGIIGLFIGPVILALGYELFLAWLHAPRVATAVDEQRPVAESSSQS
jgi:predicted PurR-regulated permease PerM